MKLGAPSIPAIFKYDTATQKFCIANGAATTNCALTIGNDGFVEVSGTSGFKFTAPGTGYYAVFDPSALSNFPTFTFPNASGTLALGTGTSGNCAKWSGTNTLTDTGAPCSSGGGALTTSTNNFTAAQTFSAGILDASATHIAPVYTYTVCLQGAGAGCDYTKLEDALAQASSTQLPTWIHIHNGTYSAPVGGYKICSDHLTVDGEGYAIRLNINGSNSNGFSMCDSTQRSDITLSNLRINENFGTASSSIGVDFDHFALSHFNHLWLSGFNNSFYASSTGTLYNHFVDNRDQPTGTANYGYYIGSTVNDTLIERTRTVANSSTICYYVGGNGTHAIQLTSTDCETGAAIAYFIDGKSHDIKIDNAYSEGNTIGFEINTSTYAVTWNGGFIATSSAGQQDIVNNGGIFAFSGANVQYSPLDYAETQANIPQIRWVKPYQWTEVSSNATSSATTTVWSEEFELQKSAFVCGIGMVTGNATDTGAIIAGISGPIATEETNLGSSMQIFATSSELGASINSGLTITLPTTRLDPGRYYANLQFTSTSTTYQRNANQTQVVGWTQTWQNNTSTQGFPATVGSITNTASNMPGMQIKMCSLSTL